MPWIKVLVPLRVSDKQLRKLMKGGKFPLKIAKALVKKTRDMEEAMTVVLPTNRKELYGKGKAAS